MRINAARKAGLAVEVTDRGAFGGAHPLDLLLDIDTLAAGVEVDIPPGHRGIIRDDLHRLVELVAESGRQVRMPGHHGVHRIAQPVRVQRAGHGEVQLRGIHIVAALGGGGVTEHPLLQRGQWQHVSDLILPAQFVDLLLA